MCDDVGGCVCVTCAGLRISEDVDLSGEAVGLVSRVRARGWLFVGMVVFCVIPAVSLFLFLYIIAKPCSLIAKYSVICCSLCSSFSPPLVSH